MKATGVKFVVKSGLGNFVSCDEMHFFKKNEDNTLATKLLTVFKDITCSELKADVTNEEINKLPSKYFVHIAEALKTTLMMNGRKNFVSANTTLIVISTSGRKS